MRIWQHSTAHDTLIYQYLLQLPSNDTAPEQTTDQHRCAVKKIFEMELTTHYLCEYNYTSTSLKINIL